MIRSVRWPCEGRAGGKAKRLSADANTVATTASPATLRQAFERAGTMVEAQPLGLPGQKVAGHAPLSDGRVRRVVARRLVVDGS